MAEEKKAPTSIFGDKHLQELVYLLAGLIILGGVIGRLTYLFTSANYQGITFWDEIVAYSKWFWPRWKIVALVLTGASIVWGVFSFLRLQKIEAEEEKIYGTTTDEAFEEEKIEVDKDNEKWLRVVEHANSNNPSDWRLAIIEADVMLEELLESLGYAGDGVGEMLKGVDPTDMLALDNAWEAHKVRNRIAHSGGDFQLNERETRRVIGLFETVFREFHVI